MIDFIQNIDWETVGATLMTFVGIYVGVKNWLRKNVVDIQTLRKDGADINEQNKHIRAMIKDNQSLKTEIANGKAQTQELTKTYTNLLKKKDAELDALKSEVKELIKIVKEESLNGIHQRSEI